MAADGRRHSRIVCICKRPSADGLEVVNPRDCPHECPAKEGREDGLAHVRVRAEDLKDGQAWPQRGPDWLHAASLRMPDEAN